MHESLNDFEGHVLRSNGNALDLIGLHRFTLVYIGLHWFTLVYIVNQTPVIRKNKITTWN
jgi:hypothetical protein